MRLYDFSIYAEKRQALKAVVDASCELEKPGVVIILKQNVRRWLQLHQELSRKAG
jgi:hypothetical protein